MDKLRSLIKSLENNIPNTTFTNPSVSQATVGWHIEHSLLTIDLIVKAIVKSTPDNYRWKFNFTRLLIFTINKFPRGKVKAPATVRPKEDLSMESLNTHIVYTLEGIELLNTLQTNQHFEHPFFGELNKPRTVKFLTLHTKHHLAIINDIVKK